MYNNKKSITMIKKWNFTGLDSRHSEYKLLKTINYNIHEILRSKSNQIKSNQIFKIISSPFDNEKSKLFFETEKVKEYLFVKMFDESFNNKSFIIGFYFKLN